MKKQEQILGEIEIDKLTNSIENTVSGDIFDTEVYPLFSKDSKQINEKDWQFKWNEQIKLKERETYKLVIKENPKLFKS